MCACMEGITDVCMYGGDQILCAKFQNEPP